MKNILSAELYKLYKSRVINVSLISCVIISVITAASRQATVFKFMESGSMGLFIGATYLSRYIIICCIIITGIFIVGEFDNGTVRNAIAAGTSRSWYYIVKLFCIMLAFTVIVLASLSAYAITKTLVNGWSSSGFTYKQYALKLAVFLCVTLSQYYIYASLCVMVAFITRSTPAAVGISLGFFIFEYAYASPNNPIGIKILDAIAKGMPGYFMSAARNVYVIGDRILTSDFKMRFVIALVVVIASTLIGMIVFIKRDLK